MILNLQKPFTAPAIPPGHDVLVLPLPVIAGKSLERLFIAGRINYQVRETFDCLADAMAIGGPSPKPMEKVEAIVPHQQYTVSDLKAMGYGQRWIARIRPSSIRPGLWLGSSILEYLHQQSRSRAQQALDAASKARDRARAEAEKDNQARAKARAIRRARRNLLTK